MQPGNSCAPPYAPSRPWISWTISVGTLMSQIRSRRRRFSTMVCKSVATLFVGRNRYARHTKAPLTPSILVDPPFQDDSSADDKAQDATEDSVQCDHHDGGDRYSHEHHDGAGLDVRLRRPHDLSARSCRGRTLPHLWQISSRRPSFWPKPAFLGFVCHDVVRLSTWFRDERCGFLQKRCTSSSRDDRGCSSVLRGAVVALLALGAGQSDFNGHLLTPPL